MSSGSASESALSNPRRPRYSNSPRAESPERGVPGFAIGPSDIYMSCSIETCVNSALSLPENLGSVVDTGTYSRHRPYILLQRHIPDLIYKRI